MGETLTGALLGVLRAHGVNGCIHDGVVWGEGHYSRWTDGPLGARKPWERAGVLIDGREWVTGCVWERVGTSAREVREWLGY